MKKPSIGICLFLLLTSPALAWNPFASSSATDATRAQALRQQAYALNQQGKFAAAADEFQQYLDVQPNDAQAAYDYAMVLAGLGRHAEAVAVLETLHRLEPARESAYFKLGTEYLALHRDHDALKVFKELQLSTNHDLAQAAAEAAARLQADVTQAELYAAQEHVYDLAKDLKYQEVIAAVDEMETDGNLPFGMALQRIYALVSLQKTDEALRQADTLAAAHPEATDLALLRANLLLQVGRKSEAEKIWRQLQADHPGTPVADQAGQHLEALTATELEKAVIASHPAPEPQPPLAMPVPTPAPLASPASDEAVIYHLADEQRFREVVQAIDDLERKQGTVSWNLQLQRLYALQGLNENRRASELAAQMAAEKPGATDLVLMQAELLVRQHRWTEAGKVLLAAKKAHPDTPLATEAERRLHALPAVADLDKWQWGEFYASGDYHNRFHTLIGSGLLREGTYVPHARWLQPYAGLRFGLDTKSGAGDPSTIVQDNSFSFVGGVRAQLFPTEYVFLYAEGGLNKDLLDRRDGGDWAGDYQAGVFGYKSWGPGVTFPDNIPAVATSTNRPPAGCGAAWRGDWFTDVGADFSYYHRFNSWLGYGQAHEGFRLAQLTRSVAWDAYAVENLAWDAKGNYFDNLGELGPGTRLIWKPRGNWRVVLRVEWVEGFYFGRDDLNSRGTASGDYNDFRAGISVGTSW